MQSTHYGVKSQQIGTYSRQTKPGKGEHNIIQYVTGDGRGDCGEQSEGEGDGGEGRVDGETEEEANKKKHRRNR